ncbi:MAG: LytR C-terminal domain-containing protein [Candidatus Eisenbacteria bacterium]|nr:LytR C-terminal domain-containing protein [Candidatus Eisenbacteria bacterium]
MARRRRSRKRSGFGRALEGMAVLMLFLVILVFGFSIASRYGGQEGERPTNSETSAAELRNTGFPGDGTASEGSPPVDTPSHTPRIGTDLPVDRVQLLVENGCGVTKLAKKFADEIRSPRFDVVDYKDADRYDYLETLVLTTERGRQEALEVLEELQARFGVGEIQLTSEPIYAADVRVILGADLADYWNRPTDVP